MILSKTAIGFLCFLLLAAIFMANLLNMIATDHNFYTINSKEGVNHTNYLAKKYGRITDTSQNIIWYLQISDIHISIFRDPGRISQFQQFCDSTVKRIKPILVLATGDLTDAKAKDNLGSSQVKTEWVYYLNIVKESGVMDETTWLDIRGNHDNFNIKTWNSEENYYRNYSIQGPKHSKSYVHFEDKNGVSVAFLGIDACPDPGLRRPFNFIGILDLNEQATILRLKAEASKADHIVWYGHYPTSCILSLQNGYDRMDLRKLIGSTQRSQVYMCGHLHAMGGLAPKMYTKHKKGYLELELGDWKDNRLFRLAAIDHGHFSFVDQKHNDWPLVLVTNPKHALYTLPGREPLQLVIESTHIRILAFSDVDVESVKISFDQVSWMECPCTDGPLYACRWLPHLFSRGLHNLYVVVTDEHKKEAFLEHPFTLDGTSMKFHLFPRILLMLDAGTVFQTIFGTLLLTNILPLIILRLHKRPPKFRRRFGNFALRRVWLLCKVDRVFYPLVLYAVYIPFGPWAIGNLIDDHIGAVFAWGILIRGVFIPEPFTYMYGSVQLMFIQLPLIVVLAHCLDYRLFCQTASGARLVMKHLPFVCLLTMQLLLAYFFWLEYGTMALCLGPLRSWSVPLSILLWYKIANLPVHYRSKLIKLDEQ